MPYGDRLWAGKMATHSISQGYTFSKDQYDAQEQRAYKLASDNYDNPAIIGTTGDAGTPTAPKEGTAIYQARQAAMKKLVLDGLAGNPDIVKKTLEEADAKVFQQATEAMGVHHPDAAARYADEHQKELGVHYQQVAEKFRARAEEIKNTNTANTIHDEVTRPGGAPVGAFTPSNVVQFPSGTPAAPRPKGWDFITKPQGAAAPARAQPNTRAMIQIESGGVPQHGGHYQGLGQFSPEEQRRFGITNPNDRHQVDVAYKLEANENKPALTAALGHEPAASDYYLAHQQGVAGAVSHLTHPNQPAWQSMAQTPEGRSRGAGWARRAIWGNMTPEMKRQFPGGVDTVTSGDFVRLWAGRHDAIANRFATSEE